MSASWVEMRFLGGVASLQDIELRLSTTSVSIRSRHGRTDLEDPSICGTSHGIRVWVNPDEEVVVVGARQSDVVYSVLLPKGLVVQVDHLLRHDEPDLRFLSVRPAPDGSLLVLYERGILCVASDGSRRWHRLHDDISARFISVDDDVVVIETQWPMELAGRRTYYRLVDGGDLPRI